jgi:hypothetical protein
LIALQTLLSFRMTATAIAFFIASVISMSAIASSDGRIFVLGSIEETGVIRFSDLAEFRRNVPCVRPGDKVLLEAGQTFVGSLRIRVCGDAGLSDRPIELRSFERHAPFDATVAQRQVIIDSAVPAPSLGLRWQDAQDSLPAGTPRPSGSTRIYRIGPLSAEPVELFYNNTRLKLARAPSEPLVSAGTRFFRASHIMATGSGGCPYALCVRTSDRIALEQIKRAAASAQIAAVYAVVRNSPWSFAHSRVAVLDEPTGEIRLNDAIAGEAMPTRVLPIAGYGFALFGSAAFLDSPGEWYFDRGNRMLYLAWDPTAQHGPPATGRSAITFASPPGYDFHTHEDAGVAIWGNPHQPDGRYTVSISRLTVVHAARDAIRAYWVPNVRVTNVHVSQPGQGGIALYEVSGRAEVAESIVSDVPNNGITASTVGELLIRDNTISACGTIANQKRFGMDLNGIRAAGFASATIVNNVIEGSGYAGVMLAEPSASHPDHSKPDIEIADNRLSRFCALLNDCGAIYVNGKQKLSGSAPFAVVATKRIIRNEVELPLGNLDGVPGRQAVRDPAVDKSGAFVRMVGAVYLDHGASGYDITGNRVAGSYEPYGWRVFNKGSLNTCSRAVADQCLRHGDGYRCYTKSLDECNLVFGTHQPPR